MNSAQQPTAGSVAPTSELRVLTADVARELGERPYAFRLIHRLLELYSEPFVREHVDRALAIDASGGMPVKDGVRRRTLGVFFHLAKQTVGQREWSRRVDPPLATPRGPPARPRRRRRRRRTAARSCSPQSQDDHPARRSAHRESDPRRTTVPD